MSNFKIASTAVVGKDNFLQNFPIGSVVPFFSTTIPEQWLLCDGSSLLKSQYLDLFNVIGYTYGGSGDNFNIPSMNNKYPSSRNADNTNVAYPINHQHNASSNAISTSPHETITHSHTANTLTPGAGSASHNHNTPISGVTTNGGITPGSNANSVSNRAVNSGPAANSPQAGWVGHTHNAGSGEVNVANAGFSHNHNVMNALGLATNTTGTAPAHTIAAFNINHTSGGVTPLALKAYFIIKY